MRFLISLLLAVVTLFTLQAQSTPADPSTRWDLSNYGYEEPMKIPAYLSGNYGELRGSHFHSGIDIKTQQVVGKPIYAIADGYVSRVAVSPFGFGRALYVAHPNGTTSVYAHLERFAPELARYVYDYQYANTTFKVDLYFPASRFPVRKGELIAYSGNSGSSGGPHLHYEVRDEAHRPMNLIAHGILSVEDTIPPRPIELHWVSIDTVRGVPVHRVDQTFELISTGEDQYTIVTQSTSPSRELTHAEGMVQVAGSGYWAVEVAEHKNNTPNPMGPYRLSMRIDGNPHYELTIDRIPFNLTRYANAARLGGSARNGVYRLFTLPNNPLPIYPAGQGSGEVRFTDFLPHKVAITLEDDCRNRSFLYFSVMRQPGARTTPPDSTGRVVAWDEPLYVEEGGLVLSILPRTLYESTFLNLSELPALDGMYSPSYMIAPQKEVLQKYMTLSIAANDLPERLRSKALIGEFSSAGQPMALGGGWRSGETPGQATTPENPHPGRVEGRTRTFGTYFIAVDTIPPRLTARFEEGASLADREELVVTVTDDFSGVESYSATIDGKWALLEYDPKTNRLIHRFDNQRWPQGATRRLEVRATDAKGNQTTLRRSYRR